MRKGQNGFKKKITNSPVAFAPPLIPHFRMGKQNSNEMKEKKKRKKTQGGERTSCRVTSRELSL